MKLTFSSRLVKLISIFVITVTILAIAACHSNTSQLKMQPSSKMRSPIATQVVDHALGKVEIPVAPQRVIVLHDMLILDSVLALGVKPIGSAYSPYDGERFRGIPPELVVDIPTVGNIGQPSIEAILALKPDLILGTHFQKNYYELLSEIAPTILINHLELQDFKERLRYIAHVLGKSDQAEELLVVYQERIKKLRQQLGEKLEKITVSVIALEGQNIYTYRTDFTLASQLINDIGLSRPLIQQNQKESHLISSIEMLHSHDADVLFVDDYEKSNTEPLSFLKKQIWSTLKAFQKKQIYEVDWGVGGPFGANRIIDDLFKYLVNTP
ncbi:iron-siderophore ABC transporter substrate-binding protein [Nodularia chucula]|uniref:iron-siderophore ABC transporter substrate-binding protein n=1 Tax=Nodularia chucula TaxID=3093667 RepID=UPI0039C6A521